MDLCAHSLGVRKGCVGHYTQSRPLNQEFDLNVRISKTDRCSGLLHTGCRDVISCSGCPSKGVHVQAGQVVTSLGQAYADMPNADMMRACRHHTGCSGLQ